MLALLHTVTMTYQVRAEGIPCFASSTALSCSMAFSQILLLAAIQGITEFIPVSSSGHLNIAHLLTRLSDQGVGMDVALHGGTLMAVMVYFRQQTGQLIRGGVDVVRLRPSENATAAKILIIATVPVLLAATLVVTSGIMGQLRTAEVVAWASIIFAVPLYLADRFGASHLQIEKLTARPALLIGLAQMLALIPGASRAGVTMMAARWLGMEREQAARFSMLLSMPVIFCFALLGLIELILQGDTTALADALIGAALAAGFAFLTIDIFIRMTRHISLLPFVLYRLALGVGLLVLIS